MPTEQHKAVAPALVERETAASLAPLSLAALAVAGCGSGGGSSGGSSGGGDGGAPPPSAAEVQASRFLSQAAIGYSHADISSVATSGIDAWLTAEFAMARPQRFWDFVVANGYADPANINTQNG